MNTSNQTQSISRNGDTFDIHMRNVTVLSFLALLPNMFVITLMLRSKKLRKRRSNKLLLNFLISNVTVCITFISYNVKVMIMASNANSFVELYIKQQETVLLVLVSVVLSMLNLTFITLDRLVAVKWPFFYEDRIQTKHIFAAIGIVWGVVIIYGIIMTILSMVYDSEYFYQYLGQVIFIVVVMNGFITLSTSNFFVFLEARRQLKAIEKISVELLDDSKTKKNKRRAKEFRVARINVGLVLCFFVFWINSLILAIKTLVYCDKDKPPASLEYLLTTWYLIKLYYLFNPVWYVTLNQEVKQELKRIFGRKIEEEVANSVSMI